jgi:hypothetical protein
MYIRIRVCVCVCVCIYNRCCQDEDRSGRNRTCSAARGRRWLSARRAWRGRGCAVHYFNCCCGCCCCCCCCCGCCCCCCCSINLILLLLQLLFFYYYYHYCHYPISSIFSTSEILTEGTYSMVMMRGVVYSSYTSGTLIQSTPRNCSLKRMAFLASFL